jgi:beta-glucosidase
MASGYIRGLQEHGVTAVIKHFICNDSEETRRTMNVVVDETTLREVYLRPFQIAFATAQPHGMMTSYNKVRHVSRRLLTLNRSMGRTSANRSVFSRES